MKNIFISRIDIATDNIHKLVNFYSVIFQISFREVKYDNQLLPYYLANIGSIQFVLAPRKLSGVEENQTGIHQLHLTMEDLSSFSEILEKENIVKNHRRGLNGDEIIYFSDPEGNPWVVHQKI